MPTSADKMRCFSLILALAAPAAARMFGSDLRTMHETRPPAGRGLPRATRTGESSSSPVVVRPTVVAGSHNLTGFEPERAVDGDEKSYWLVPGGQRMELMSRDKWLVFDLGGVRRVRELRLLGYVSTLGAAHATLQSAPTADGPWRRVRGFRALKALDWQSVPIGGPDATARFLRLHIRREGHATFRHAVHGVEFGCEDIE